MNILSASAVVAFLASTDAFVPSHPMAFRSSTTTTTALNGLLGRFREKDNSKIGKLIDIGAPIPEVDVEMLMISEEDEVTTIPISINEVLGGTGKSILVGMPGAFTPVCTSEHLPGFLKASSQLQNLGVDTIAVVTTNDKFVNEAWARSVGLIVSDGGSTNMKSTVTILADGDGDLVKTLGLAEDMGFGVGIRSKRFALVCENGVVTNVLMDEEGLDRCEMTSATNLVKVLTPEKVSTPGHKMDQRTLATLGGGLALAVVAMFMMAGGGDHSTTATFAVPAAAKTAAAMKAGAAVKAGSKATQFSLLQQYGN